MHMHKVFDKPRHLSEIHAAQQVGRDIKTISEWLSAGAVSKSVGIYQQLFGGRGDTLAPDGAKVKDHRAHKSAAASVMKNCGNITTLFDRCTPTRAPQELASVELGKGGAGRKGGLREYARQVGRGENRIREWTQAASVVKNCANIGAVFDRTYHLAAIHAAPQELWPVFVEALLAQDWTVADTRPQKVTGAT